MRKRSVNQIHSLRRTPSCSRWSAIFFRPFASRLLAQNVGDLLRSAGGATCVPRIVEVVEPRLLLSATSYDTYQNDVGIADADYNTAVDNAGTAYDLAVDAATPPSTGSKPRRGRSTKVISIPRTMRSILPQRRRVLLTIPQWMLPTQHTTLPRPLRGPRTIL